MNKFNFPRKNRSEPQSFCIKDWELYHKINGTEEKTIRLIKKMLQDGKYYTSKMS